MFGKVVPVVLVVLAVISWIGAVPMKYDNQWDTHINCEKNEVYTRTEADCQPTCDNPHPSICNKIGMPGCLCDKGYIRYLNRCVKVSECPPEKY